MTDSTGFKLSNIADRSAVWKLRVSKFTVYKRDKAATQLVTNSNEGRKVGNFNKKLFDGCAPVESCNAAFQACYDLWFARTVPYLDYDGERMIDSRHLIDTMREFGALKEEAYLQRSALADAWDACVAWDVARLKHLGNPADYPTSPIPYYHLDSQLRPVPSHADFRFDVPEEDKRALEEQLNKAEERAKIYVMDTMTAPIAAFIKRAAEFTGEKGQRWHDSIVTNIKDIVDQAKSLNIVDDPNIDGFIKELDAYCTGVVFNPTVLKESVAHRDAAKDKLAEIMKRMGAYAGSI